MRWVGLDLHKRYITACALDEAGQVIAEHRRIAAMLLSRGLRLSGARRAKRSRAW
jgi:hypothetical protein